MKPDKMLDNSELNDELLKMLAFFNGSIEYYTSEYDKWSFYVINETERREARKKRCNLIYLETKNYERFCEIKSKADLKNVLWWKFEILVNVCLIITQ